MNNEMKKFEEELNKELGEDESEETFEDDDFKNTDDNEDDLEDYDNDEELEEGDEEAEDYDEFSEMDGKSTILNALVELLIEKGVISEKELMEKVNSDDLGDYDIEDSDDLEN